MAYGRDERDPRDRNTRYDEPRDRFSRSPGRGERGTGERGFFERAGDEISSWFGDDEAERRREMDERSTGDYRGAGRADRGGPGRAHYSDFDERSARFRDEPPRRPYSGRPPERSEPVRDRGRDMGRDQGYRPMTGDYGRSSADRFDRDASDYGRAGAAVATAATAVHDDHYSEWRQRQIDEIDRDYDEYRREHQSKFEDDFSNWRSTRQSKRQMLGSIREHMDVLGSDGQIVGKVDKVRGDRIILTKSDSPDAQHHSVNCALIDRVEGDTVYLGKSAEDARALFGNEERDRALYERDDRREPGAHILDRSFSGTY